MRVRGQQAVVKNDVLLEKIGKASASARRALAPIFGPQTQSSAAALRSSGYRYHLTRGD